MEKGDSGSTDDAVGAQWGVDGRSKLFDEELEALPPMLAPQDKDSKSLTVQVCVCVRERHYTQEE